MDKLLIFHILRVGFNALKLLSLVRECLGHLSRTGNRHRIRTYKLHLVRITEISKNLVRSFELSKYIYIYTPHVYGSVLFYFTP